MRCVDAVSSDTTMFKLRDRNLFHEKIFFSSIKLNRMLIGFDSRIPRPESVGGGLVYPNQFVPAGTSGAARCCANESTHKNFI